MALPVCERIIQISDHSFRMRVPDDQEALLNAAVTGQGIDPYWGKIWDSAVHAGNCVLQQQWPEGLRCLEIGCGCGLLGVACAAAGMELTFSDHEPAAVELASENAQLNGFNDVNGCLLDWRRPISASFDAIVGSDILYDESLNRELLRLFQCMLNDSGWVGIGDPGRRSVAEFLNEAQERGFSISIFDSKLKRVATPAINDFQWIVLKRNRSVDESNY